MQNSYVAGPIGLSACRMTEKFGQIRNEESILSFEGTPIPLATEEFIEAKPPQGNIPPFKSIS